MMAARNLRTVGDDDPQITIPGIDMSAIKEQGWDLDHPVPVEFEDALEFLRAHCKTTLTMSEGYDKIRVILKVDTPDINERKFEQVEELDPPGINNHRDKILRLAREAHSFKRKIELAESIGR